MSKSVPVLSWFAPFSSFPFSSSSSCSSSSQRFHRDITYIPQPGYLSSSSLIVAAEGPKLLEFEIHNHQKFIETLKFESAMSELQKLILEEKPHSDVEKIERLFAMLCAEAKKRAFASLDAEAKVKLFSVLDAEVKEHNRLFTAPEKDLCYHFNPDLDPYSDLFFPSAHWTRFSAVNLHSGNRVLGFCGLLHRNSSR